MFKANERRKNRFMYPTNPNRNSILKWSNCNAHEPLWKHFTLNKFILHVNPLSFNTDLNLIFCQPLSISFSTRAFFHTFIYTYICIYKIYISCQFNFIAIYRNSYHIYSDKTYTLCVLDSLWLSKQKKCFEYLSLRTTNSPSLPSLTVRQRRVWVLCRKKAHLSEGWGEWKIDKISYNSVVEVWLRWWWGRRRMRKKGSALQYIQRESTYTTAVVYIR